MAQEDRNMERSENLRLAHRSRNRIRPEGGERDAERRMTVNEVPGGDSPRRPAGSPQRPAGQQSGRQGAVEG